MKTKLRFFVKPVITAVILGLVWLFIRLVLKFIPNTRPDTEIMTTGTISVLGIFYALVAAFVISTVWRQFVQVQEAVKMDNEQAFIKHKDKRIPLPIKLLLLTFSGLLIGAFFFISFHTVVVGFYSVMAIGLGLALNWAVIMDLDDPFEGIWNVHVPEKWHKHKNSENIMLMKIIK
jgi:hypothetical protein